MTKYLQIFIALLIVSFGSYSVIAQGFTVPGTLASVNLEDSDALNKNLTLIKKTCPVAIITQAEQAFYLVQKNISRTIASKDTIGRSVYIKQLFSSVSHSYEDISKLSDEQNCFYSYGFLLLQSYVSGLYKSLPSKVSYHSLSPLGVASYLQVMATFYEPSRLFVEEKTNNVRKTLFDKSSDSSLSELSYLTEQIYYFVLYDLYRSNILTVEDVGLIVADTTFRFDEENDCGVYFGQYSQSHGSDGSQFAGLDFRISTCLDWRLISQYEQKLKQLVLHEVAHYLQEYTDTDSSNFSSICRDAGTKGKCTTEDFVSRYAMSNEDEDYAETFSHVRIGHPVPTTSLILAKKYSHMMFTYPKS